MLLSFYHWFFNFYLSVELMKINLTKDWEILQINVLLIIRMYDPILLVATIQSNIFSLMFVFDTNFLSSIDRHNN